MSPKRRILYIAPSAGLGGAETFLRHTARFHTECEPFYLCFHDGPLVSALRAAQRSVNVLPRAPRLRDPLSVARTIGAIRHFAREQKIDLVHSTMAYGALFGAPAAKLSGLDHVWFQHGPVSGWIDHAAAYAPAQAVLVNSRFTADRQGRYGRHQRLLHLRLGVDFERVDTAPSTQSARDALRAQWGISPQAFLIGTACRPQPQKGLEDFVRAIARAARVGKREIRGVILGADGSSYQDRVQWLIGKIGAPVQFVAATDSPFPSIRAFDLLVSCAVQPEALGLTLLEGMALGVPTLAPNEGGPAEIIVDGENGNLFRARNLACLEKAMVAAAQASTAERAAVAQRAEKHVRSRHDAIQCVAQLEAIYFEIMRRCPATAIARGTSP